MMIDRFIPNSFQISNEFVDSLMGELSGNAIKCYLIIVRKTRGWGKESDAISISQFIDGKKLKDARTVKAALAELLDAGLIQKREFSGRPSVYFLTVPPTNFEGTPPTKNVPTAKNVPPTNFEGTPPTKNVPHKKQENKDFNNPLTLTPRQRGTNPRALGTNPRAIGTNPRAVAERFVGEPTGWGKANPEDTVLNQAAETEPDGCQDQTDLQAAQAERRDLNAVPSAELLEAYNDTLGDILPPATVLTSKRRSLLIRRWNQYRNTKTPNGRTRFTDRASGLEWFKAVFAKVRGIPFMVGAASSGWRADLDWILDEKNFLRVVEWMPQQSR